MKGLIKRSFITRLCCLRFLPRLVLLVAAGVFVSGIETGCGGTTTNRSFIRAPDSMGPSREYVELSPEEREELLRRKGGLEDAYKGAPPEEDKLNMVTDVGNLPEMSRPIQILFMAVKDNKPDLLQKVFSKRIKTRFMQQNKTWNDIHLFYKTQWRKKFGDWRLQDIFFDSTVWSPDQPGEGKVQVSFRPREGKVLKTIVPVVKEDGLWRLDED